MSTLLSPALLSAQQQNEIVLTVDFDGTPAFSAADSMDDGAGAHTPGLDLNDSNSVVRTYDQVQYRIDWNVNEVDGTTTILRMTLPEGMTWLEDATTNSGVPSGCLDDGSSSITTDDGRTLICNTDAEHEGSNGAIHPRAFVSGLLDGTALNVTASVETDQAPPVVSNAVETIVSAAPGGDWIKGEPVVDADSGDIIGYVPDETYFDVPNDAGELGRIFVWNLRLEPAGGLKGSEPLNDAVDLEFWDHFYDSVPGTALATPAQMLAATGLTRVPCGGYDGDGAYPFGITVPSSTTTPPAQTNIGDISCTDVTASAGTTYPVIKFDITGHDTANIAAQNADLSGNSSTLISAQVAFWAPEGELGNKAPPGIIVNAITGSDAPISAGTVDVDPIFLYGTNGAVAEVSEGTNGLAGMSNNSPYQLIDEVTGNPGRSVRHSVQYLNGPYAEVQIETGLGQIFQIYDYRATTFGGTGRVVTNGSNGVDQNTSRWDGDGQTPRGNILTVMNNIQTITSRTDGTEFYAPIHSCVAVDTTHQEVIGMPATFPISYTIANPNQNASQQSNRLQLDTVGGSTGTPATPIANVISGEVGGHIVGRTGVTGSFVEVSSPELDWTLEVAALADEGNIVDVNGVSCNGDEATWVDAATGDLAQFQTDTLADGTPVYGLVTHFRLRTAGDVPWDSDFLTANDTSYGARMHLNFQVRVKEDPGVQVADQELFVYASRAWGEWDGTGQPPTTNCTNNPRFSTFDPDPSTADTAEQEVPLGWCNLPFEDDGADTLDVSDFKNDFDGQAIETSFNNLPRGVHADVVYIVEAGLAISKANTDGPSDIVANGQTIEFEINPKVVGSSLDSIADVTVTDTLPATMAFVGFTAQPSQGSCAVSGQTITCSYGDQVGGWGSLDEGKFSFEVLVQDAGANATLTNTATITGEDPLNPGVAKTPASARASAFTGAAFEESGIEKFVDPHLGECFEAPGTDHDPGDCTFIATDGGMVFTLDIENEGNVDLTNYRVVDVLPWNGDAVEPPSAPHPFTGVALTGDGRVGHAGDPTPPSDFGGDLNFVGAVTPTGTVTLYSADDPATISRDPAVAEDGITTWCDAPAGGTAVPAGLGAAAGTGACPATADDVTALHFDIGTLDKGATELIDIQLTTVGAECGDIWTNNFGARTDGLLLSIRSNDVSVMSGFCEPEIEIEKDTNGLDSDTAPGATIVVGEPVTWTYVVENTGDMPLLNATVTDVPAPAGGIDCAGTGSNVIPLLAIGEVVTCVATGIATEGPFSNNATVSGDPALPDFSDPAIDPADPSTWPTDAAAYATPVDPVTGDPMAPVDHEDPSHYTGLVLDPAIDIEKDTNGADSDAAPGESLVAGELVTWTYVVENTGNAALIDAEVTDVDSTGTSVLVDCDVDGDGALDGTNIIPLLLPTETVTCESTGVAGPGPYSNNASVTGTTALPTEDCVCDPTDPTTWPTDPASFAAYVDPVTGLGIEVDAEDPSNYTGVEPDIDIEKLTENVQSDTAPGETLFAGQDVTWTYVVENTGDTALLNATVSDSDPAVVVDCGDGTNVIAFLAIGDIVTCTATGTAVTGDYMNTATVSGDPALPDFSDPAVDPSDPSTWPTDPAAYAVPLDPDGNPVGPVEDADDSHYTGLANGPGIGIEKATEGEDSDIAPGETLFAGQDVTWTYVVQNTGTTALANATVADSDPAVVVDCGDGTNVIAFLAVGAFATCTATGTAVTGDYQNTATVSGDPITPDAATCGCDPLDPATWPTDASGYVPAVGADGALLGPVDDADDSHYTGLVNDPSINIEKDTEGVQSDEAPGETLFAGQDVTWTYVVENDGNTALANATVADSDPAVVVDCGDGTNVIAFLAVGAFATCTATGTAITGDYQNTATVTGDPLTPDAATCGCDPLDPTTWPTDASGYLPAVGADGALLGPVDDADDSHYTGLPNGPGIGIEKDTNGEDSDTAPGEQIAEGSEVVWTYVVENTGTTALANVTVGDSDSSLTVDCGDGTGTIAFLAFGGSVTCTATGTASVGDYQNTATVTGDPVTPDAATCGCDPLDPTTWPADGSGYLPAVGEDGLALGPVDAADDSHYDGVPSVFDLALDKALAPGQADNVEIGADVTFIITITNQGDLDAVDVVVTDSLPASMELNDPDWTDNGDGTADFAIVDPILAGTSVEVEITVTVVSVGSLENNAEITSATPSFEGVVLGIAITDIDSTPGDGIIGDDDQAAAAVTVNAVPASLAFTGFTSVWLAFIAMLMLIAGAVLEVARRRRNEFA